MLCGNCKVDRLINEFINNQKFCYHCMYRIKLQKSMEKRTKKQLLCRTCGQEFVTMENQKKRQRTIFCSLECAEKGHKHQLNNHWTRKVGQQKEIISGTSINNRSNTKNCGCNL
jgi:hypothetical protein